MTSKKQTVKFWAHIEDDNCSELHEIECEHGQRNRHLWNKIRGNHAEKAILFNPSDFQDDYEMLESEKDVESAISTHESSKKSKNSSSAPMYIVVKFKNDLSNIAIRYNYDKMKFTIERKYCKCAFEHISNCIKSRYSQLQHTDFFFESDTREFHANNELRVFDPITDETINLNLKLILYQTYHVKLKLHSTHVRFKLKKTKNESLYKKVLHETKQSFNAFNRKDAKFHFQYIDVDGDLVDILDENQFEEALHNQHIVSSSQLKGRERKQLNLSIRIPPHPWINRFYEWWDTFLDNIGVHNILW